MTQKELDRVLQQHKLWLETEGAEGVRADLRGADLRGVNLQGAALHGVSLQGADLRGANLQDANLWGANLFCTNLRGADLRGTNLGRADLRVANLVGAQLDIRIRDCWSFWGTKFTPGALPWLILHPLWNEFKDSVQIEEVEAV